MGIISRIFYFFAPYTDARERSAGLFFKSLNEHSSQSQTRTRLDDLLQRNIAVINLWTEYRYKGYKYLRKSERKKLYGNVQRIADDFDLFYKGNVLSDEQAAEQVRNISSETKPDLKKIALLQALTNYFSPARGLYEYCESSSFGRLLRDPSKEKLIGDCNQIVTLYIYLYSRYFDVRDLRVRVLPGHVALHYGGIDIEATNGTFMNYGEETKNILPIEEIVSINLLDITDSYLSTHEVAAEDFLQASRFAFILSHERDIVTGNLEAAYGKLINSLMRSHNYKKALTFARASRDMTLIGIVGHNGAVYEMERHNYAAARRFAQHSPKSDELIRNSWQSEGIYYYNAHRYHDAIKAFKHSGDQKLIRQCYEGLFFEEQKKLGAELTSESIKKYAPVIKRMREYAKESGDKKLIKYTEDLQKYL